MRVLVSSGSGYIGSIICCDLISNGHEVVCFDLRPPASAAIHGNGVGDKYRYVSGDIRDRSAVQSALDGIEAVVHLAAIVGYPACDAAPNLSWSTNIGGTKTLLECLPYQFPFIFLSTCSAYGNNNAASIDESCIPNPLTIYGHTKLQAERAVLEYDGVVLRPVTAYGPSPRFRADLLPHDFIMQGLLGATLHLFQQDAVRPLIHISDVCESIAFCIDRLDDMRGRVHNLGPCHEGIVTKGELAGLIARLTGLVIAMDFETKDPDKRTYRIDSSKLQRLGFLPRHLLRDGLNETYRWMQMQFHHEVAAQ